MNHGFSFAGVFTIPRDHPCFPGHMPGYPLVPGALLLDHVLDLLTRHDLIAVPFGGVTVKFLSPVGPAEEVAVRGRPSRMGGFAFEGWVGERRVLSGRVSGVA